VFAALPAGMNRIRRGLMDRLLGIFRRRVHFFKRGLDKNSDSFGVINELQEIAEVSLLGALGQKIIKTKI